MKKDLSRIKLFFTLLIVSLAYTLPAFNKYWAPYDEGIIAVASQCLLAGKVPYKDFFIIMYPPGQIYVLAFLFKIFSFSLIAGRIYTVFLSAGISLLVFYMTLALTKNRVWSFLSWFFVLVALAPRLGAIPSPIWPGVFLALLTIYAFMRCLDLEKIGATTVFRGASSLPKSGSYSYFLTGFVGGLAVLFRHDIGIFALAAVFIPIFIKRLHDKKAARDMFLFFIGIFTVILPVAAYFAFKTAAKDMVNSLVFFPFIHRKTSALAFPGPCFNPNLILHGSLHFIKVNQYYIPVLAYLFTSIWLFSRFFKGKIHEKVNLALLSVLLFGIFTFNQVITRTDPAHLLTVISPAAILFGFLAARAAAFKFNLRVKVLSLYGATAVLLFLFSLLSVKNIDKYVKNNFRKVYKKDVILTRFERGAIYVPKNEREDITNTLDFIEKNTAPGEKIYVGNISHSKGDFNGSILLYFLADRLPATKYYEQAPGLFMFPEVRGEIRHSLAKNNVNVLVLQDIAADYAGSGSIDPDDFISENYRRARKFGKYNIYVRRENSL